MTIENVKCPCRVTGWVAAARHVGATKDSSNRNNVIGSFEEKIWLQQARIF